MSKRKHGLGLLGLLAVTALVVMAFASSAQAVEVPKFFVGGTLAPANTIIEGKQETRGTLLVGALNLEINCEKGRVTSGKILTAVLADAAVLFEECTALEFKSPLAELPCHVSDVHTGNAGLLHVTVLEKTAVPIEFDKSATDYGILFQNISVFVNFLSGTGCPLPLKSEVHGAVCALIDNNESVEPTLLFSEAIQKLEGCEDTLQYGVNTAFIDASAKVWVFGKGSTLGVLLDL
jgi:hypothetical protein